MNTEDLINWRELSRYLSGNGGSLYRNRIPKKHAKNIESLKSKIAEWISEQE